MYVFPNHPNITYTVKIALMYTAKHSSCLLLNNNTNNNDNNNKVDDNISYIDI